MAKISNKALTRTRDIFILYLKEFLKDTNNYKEIVDYDLSNILIYDKQPTTLRDIPAILISAMSGNYITSGLSDIVQEVYDENNDCIAFRYGGMIELPITIELICRSTRERDEISDLLALALRVILRRNFESQGIVIKDMRYNGDSEILYDTEKLYIASLQFNTWMEWYTDLPLLSVKGIDINYD